MSYKIINGKDIQERIREGTLLAHIADKNYNPNKDSQRSLIDYYCVYVGPYTKDDYYSYLLKEMEVAKDMGLSWKGYSYYVNEYDRYKNDSKIRKYITGSIDFEVYDTHLNLDEEGFFYVINRQDRDSIVSKLFKILHQI